MKDIVVRAGSFLADTENAIETKRDLFLIRKMDEIKSDEFIALSDEDKKKTIEEKFIEKYGNSKTLSSSIDIFIDELKFMSENKGIYLIDDDTGKVVMKINESDMFNARHIDENGKESPGMLTLNPAISTFMCLLKQEESQRNKILKKAPEHLHRNIKSTWDPTVIGDEIEDMVKENFSVCPDNEGSEFVVITTKEVDTQKNNINFKFSRQNMIKDIARKKIKDELAEKVRFVSIEKKNNSKYFWFELKFMIKKAESLHS